MGKETLKCDTVGCGFVKKVASISRDMIGTPCPACGSSLLTERDWQAWKHITMRLHQIEDVAPKGALGSCKRVAINVNVHNSKVTLEVTDKHTAIPLSKPITPLPLDAVDAGKYLAFFYL